ncbi:hypothetical protein EDB87DRAFT_1574723 [Lactarius vividus]|nr:hypothetical protein EDB87DRAFT_1574723 [Lactarius vividus]
MCPLLAAMERALFDSTRERLSRRCRVSLESLRRSISEVWRRSGASGEDRMESHAVWSQRRHLYMPASSRTRLSNSRRRSPTDFVDASAGRSAMDALVTYPALGLCAVDTAHRFVERGDNTASVGFLLRTPQFTRLLSIVRRKQVHPNPALRPPAHQLAAQFVSAIEEPCGPHRVRRRSCHQPPSPIILPSRRPGRRGILGYDHHELRPITGADLDKVRSKSYPDGLLQLEKLGGMSCCVDTAGHVCVISLSHATKAAIVKVGDR